MVTPASSLCVSTLIMEDNESLAVRGLMNEPSQSHRKEALDERKWRERGRLRQRVSQAHTCPRSGRDVLLVNLLLWRRNPLL